MLKKSKKNLLLGLAGTLLATSAAGAALASCTTTTNTSDTTNDVQYSYVIDWNNQAQVERLNIDDTGLVYSDSSRTTIIAVSPRVNLATVTIPSTVKSIIGYSKVSYMNTSTGVVTDTIPSGATTTDYVKVYQSVGAFQGMESLTSITLQTGSQLQAIGGLAFANCTNLKTISGLSSTLTLIGTQAFQNCSSLTSIDTSNVLKFGNYAFQNCSSLNKVDLTNTIYVGQNTFENCSSLASIGSVENLRSIGQNAFSGAISSSAQLTLKFSNLLSVANSAFQSANGLSTLDFSNNTMLTSVGSNAFSGTSVTTVDFTGCSNLQTISTAAFENCKNLTTVNIPAENASSLVSIGNSAFSGATSLTTVAPKVSTGFVATSGLITIGNYAFANTAIASINLANTKITSFTSDNSYALTYITKLSSVTLPSTLTTLPAGMFYGSGLESDNGFSLTLSSTITSLGYSNSITINDTTVSNASPFTNSGLATIDLSNVTSYQTTEDQTLVLPNYLFSGLTKLTSVTLKTETTGIGQNTFASTSALTSITYPSAAEETPTADTTSGFSANSSLTTIGTDAFKGAFSATSNATVDLTQMTLSGTTAPDAFDESNIQTLNLPTSVTTISANSFESMTKLTTVNFSDLTNLTTIGTSSFTSANSLSSIDLSNSTSLTGLDTTASIFTGLPTNATVQLPKQISTAPASTSFTIASSDDSTSTTQASFTYPSGISLSGTTSNTYTLGGSNTNPMLQKVSGTLDLNKTIDSSSNSTLGVKWIKSYTFFGNTSLTDLIFPIGSLNANASTAGQARFFDADDSVNSLDNSVYAYGKVPFGDNENLNNITINNFLEETSPSWPTTSSYSLLSTRDVESSSTIEVNPLYKTTAQTWAQVATFINKFASNSTTSPTAWPTSFSSGTDTTSSINSDSVITQSSTSGSNGSYSLVFTNVSQTSAGSTIESRTFNFSNSMTDDSEDGTTLDSISQSFIHNGVTWTLIVNSLSSKTNPGMITLVGENINVYKLTYTNSTGQITGAQIPFKSSTTSKASNGITVTLKILNATTSSTTS